MPGFIRKIALSWNAVILIAVLLLILGGTWGAVKYATDRLLYAGATDAAQEWADLLATSIDDLDQIATGMMPRHSSSVFFDWAKQAGQVFRYEIYNRQGYSQLISDDGLSLVDISTRSSEAVQALESGRPVVDVFDGDGSSRPAFYSRAFVPAYIDGEAVAIIAAYVDQTDERERFRATFTLVAAFLCLLTGLAFSLPSLAWLKRNREKQIADQRIRFLAHHDALTGLINRARLVEQLRRELAVLRLGRGSSGLAVYFVDLDRFKEINDTQGHDAGDMLLCTVAQRLQADGGDGDLISRLGGDEFVLVQRDVADRKAAEAFAGRLTRAIAEPVRLGEGLEVATTASIGIALAPADGVQSERLLKCADLALYAAKESGKNCARFFDPQMDVQLNQRIKLENRVREAVQHGAFELHYQPIIDMQQRVLIGFEALVRLPANDGSLIPAGTFIPVAEELRLIDQVGEWVLDRACTAAASWPEHLKVAVNLSPAQFDCGDVSEIVGAVLAKSGLAPQRLELEVTERLLLGVRESVIAELARIKQMGVSIAIDDFGTGTSSLSNLWRFNFDQIKIDRSFMQGLSDTGHDAQQLVRTIIALGRELDMRVTVEGVENPSQVSFLEDINAEQAQGFYFGRPVPESELSRAIIHDFTQSVDEHGHDPPAQRVTGVGVAGRS